MLNQQEIGIDHNTKPSDIKRGWHLKYYYKVEADGKLGLILDFFEKTGNKRSMPIEKWESLINTYEENIRKETKNPNWKISNYVSRNSVTQDVLEKNKDHIQFRESVIEALQTFQKDDIIYLTRKKILNTIHKILN